MSLINIQGFPPAQVLCMCEIHLSLLQVAIPIEDVNRSHLRFTFKHRSSQDCKFTERFNQRMAYLLPGNLL